MLLKRVCEFHIMNGSLTFSFISHFGLIFKASSGLKLIILSILSFSALMTIHPEVCILGALEVMLIFCE